MISALKSLIISLFLLSTQLFASESYWNKAWQDFSTPVTTNARYISLGGILATSMIAFNEKDFNNRARDQIQFDPPLKEYGVVGEALGWGYLNALYGLGFWAHYQWKDNKKSLERLEIMTLSSLYTLFWTSGLKVMIKSRRPGYPQENDSFPSGHASMAFAFASVVTAEHGIYWGLPSYLVASFISLSRMNDDWHWLEDVIAGATIGASYGWGIYLNRRKKELPFWITYIPSPRGLGRITFIKTF